MAGLTIRHVTGVSPRAREWERLQRMQEWMRMDPLEAVESWLGGREAATFVPAFEVKETKGAYVFRADLPGVEEKDLEVTLTGEQLVVSGKREAEARQEGERFFAYERSFGAFRRIFTLPEGVDGENVKAELRNGVLTLTVPKRPEVQPRQIKVNVGTGEHAKA